MPQPKQEQKPSLIIAGQFPPPLHGFSYITQQMAKLLSKQYNTTIIDLVPHTKRGGALYHARRALLALKGAFTILRHKRKTPVYIACESHLGLLYTILLSASARITKSPIYIHYHNFNFIDEYSLLMALLLKILGKNATHIFLCSIMAQRFAARYQATIKSVVISNSAFVPQVDAPIKPKSDVITLGLLSNLNEEKGLSLFIGALENAINEGLNIKGILAGPPVSENDRKTIEIAQERLGGKLDYRGAVYEQDKAQFFKDIDVFVFPTQYSNEAQPTVIAEAMSYGIPVLSCERGCICDQVGGCGSVFSKDKDFINEAVLWIKGNAVKLDALKTASKQAFLDDRAKALEAAHNMLMIEPQTIRPQ